MPIRRRFWQICKKRFAFLRRISHLCKRNEENGKYLVVAHLQLGTVSSYRRRYKTLTFIGTLTYSVPFLCSNN
jgi:hypothetical protein